MPLFKRREQVPNLALLRQECREFIRQLPLTDPDEDWIPTAIYYGADGPGVVAFNLDPDHISEALEEFLVQNDVTAWGVWATTWFVLADDVDEAPGIRPAEHPRGFEALLLRLHAADKSAIEIARIERHENAPPTIGKWELLEEKEWEILEEG
jgi:hypothetical protein